MLITTSSLRKEFGEVIAVNDINLEIPKGAIYGLIGPNGAGKTTTFRMITGLLEPTTGSVNIEGIDVWRDPLSAFAKIGYMPDFFSLYPELKVWEYLDYFANTYKLPKQEIAEKIDEVLSMVNLIDKKNAFIKGLSRGMTQRLCIAKTIIHNPELIILDEPASGLDPIARKELMQTLLRLNRQDKTILISSHILSELSEVCNYVGIMENGKLVKSGEINSVIDESKATIKIEIETLDKPDKVIAYLNRIKGIIGLELTPNGCIFDLVGDNKRVVQLHKMIMAKGFLLTSFAKRKKDISDIFMEVSKKP